MTNEGKVDEMCKDRRMLVELGNLKLGDIFHTEYYYALKDTSKRCNTFVVINVTKNNNVKCMACNFKYPQMFYFKKDKKVIL